MNYKHYIPLADRKDLYKHALLHAQLTSPELASDVLRMTKHIDFMHEAMAHCNEIIKEWIEEYREKRDHPFKNLWRWTCNLIDKVITS
jgi:hypothetical protein